MKKLAKILAFLLTIVIIATGCKKLPEFTDGSGSTPTPVTPVLDEPTVITKAVVSVGITDAVCGGSVEYSGYYELTAVGFCWSEKDEPTIEDHYSVEATSAGSFVGKINNLSPNTTYYVRTYATNANGIYYGNVLEFTTLESGGSNDYYNLYLNEVDGTDKFIEIFNNGETNIVLEGLYIIKDDGESPKWIGDGSITIRAYDYIVLYSEDVIANHPEYEGTNYIINCGISSRKTLKLALFLPDGTQRDVFTRGVTGVWGVNISDVCPLSFARTPDTGDWKLSESTPGMPNPTDGVDIPQE